jgi:hypothetical protein
VWKSIVSREGARCRAREHAAYLDLALGAGATQLLGCPVLVLSFEPRSAAPPSGAMGPAANASAPSQAGQVMLLQLPHEPRLVDPVRVD